MIKKLDYQISNWLFEKLKNEIPDFEHRIEINSPTGNFFYDEWKISEEFANTAWEVVLSSLPFSVGEARLMKLEPGTAYYSHADVDDRYHLNICGEKSFLVDLDASEIHSVDNDGYWYEMNAGIRHSAVNFGNKIRIQLVVRKLLKRNNLKDSLPVKISLEKPMHDYRYVFDNTYSPWLNKNIKEGLIDDFCVKDDQVFFRIEKTMLDDLKKISPTGFIITVCQ